MSFFKKLFTRKPRVELVDYKKRFELFGRVGQGSMSKVWKARDSKSGRIVALKVLDKVKTERFESRFLAYKSRKPTEGEIAVQLVHPNIVRTLEHGWTTDKEQFLVMEFVDGSPLSFFVETQNEVLQRHRLRLMIEIGEAITYFHNANWIHRDICPRNVLVNQEHHAKLIDFGLVVPNTSDFQRPGNRTGTANYMAPELIKRQRTDQRIDIFSYAVTCYEMYAAALPWEAAETLEMVLQHINQPPTDIREHVADIDEKVAETIMRGIAPRPDDRWSRVEQMTEAFQEARQHRSKSSS